MKRYSFNPDSSLAIEALRNQGVAGRVLTPPEVGASRRHIGLKPDLRSNGLFGFNALLFIALMSAMFYGTTAFAATTDIAQAPLASASDTVVKPNIMFVLDDTGSMYSTYMPDTVYNTCSTPSEGILIGSTRYRGNGNCYRNHLCNRIYYNPDYVYTPPVKADGTSYPNATYADAQNDGFQLTNIRASDKTNLGSGFTAVGNEWVYSAPQQAYYYKYTGSQTLAPGDCDTTDSRYTKVSVPPDSPEAQNFANWFSYYHTRLLTMKTAVGNAFKGIGDNYRVGYSAISYTGTDSNNAGFLKIADFDTTQRSAWYTKVYGAGIGAQDKPLRAALSKAGRLYAGKLLTGADDPVQYSCQQNFTLLTTDGVWSPTFCDPIRYPASIYGSCDPTAYTYKLDGAINVGNQDGTAATPMKDALNKSDTLADVAMYYYQTDLRTSDLGNCTGAKGTGTDVCEDNVRGSGADINTQQHMTTFTLGMGISGTLAYSEDYLSGGSADYNKILQGTLSWPDPFIIDSNWSKKRVDDLWHAAVNGRGIYFSAQNPDSLASGLGKALAGVTARVGSSAAAATSNLEPVAGDNYVYIALYRTVKWDGDLQAKTIDPSTGAISATPVWSAQPLLDAKISSTSNTRVIYTFDSTASNKLKLFTWDKLSTAEKAYFDEMCSKSPQPSQCATPLTAAQQAHVSGQNLVDFIRGQDGYESQTTNSEAKRIYRDREHVLGDMVSSQPVYVKTPSFSYGDAGYSDFKTAQKNRAAMVYVAVNDGMIHAFDGGTGQEQWAYIPPAVMPNLYKLADTNYPANHQYYVDGSPTVGDICPNAPSSTCSKNDWKTILVGGLNAGGRGYYALDITSPTGPKALWNFTDDDLGYTFGNPVIAKRKDGTWVVVFTSGYNNVSPGDGKGYLYIVNANTGALLEKISTGTGDATTPSGLAKINAWIDDATDNTAKRFYGGDLLGNVWRFEEGKAAFLLATVGQINGAGTQSITTKPELTEITTGGKSYAVVNVGTGRYLGLGDLGDTSQQSVYSFKDDLTTTGLGLVRDKLVKQTLTTFSGPSGEKLRTSSTNAVDWAAKSGWYVDLNPSNESPGERVNVDMQMQLGLLTVAGNVPNTNACNLGGYAWLYYFDYKTGQYVSTSTSNAVGKRLSTNALVAGLKTIKLTTGKTLTIITDTGGVITGNADPSPSATESKEKRVSWRELVN